MKQLTPELFIERKSLSKGKLPPIVDEILAEIGANPVEEYYDVRVSYCFKEGSAYSRLTSGVRGIDIQTSEFPDFLNRSQSSDGVWISSALAHRMLSDSGSYDETTIYIPRAGVRVPENCAFDSSDMRPVQIFGVFNLDSDEMWLFGYKSFLSTLAFKRLATVFTLHGVSDPEIAYRRYNDLLAVKAKQGKVKQEMVPPIIRWYERLSPLYRSVWYTVSFSFTVINISMLIMVVIYMVNQLMFVFVELRNSLYLTRFLGARPRITVIFLLLTIVALFAVMVAISLIILAVFTQYVDPEAIPAHLAVLLEFLRDFVSRSCWGVLAFLLTFLLTGYLFASSILSSERFEERWKSLSGG